MFGADYHLLLEEIIYYYFHIKEIYEHSIVNGLLNKMSSL